MKAEIITIGDEILIGQVVNTNAAYLAEELNKTGLDVIRITCVPDHEDSILHALDESLQRADLIITTGGLGPTRDDITKKTLAAYFDSKLVMNHEVLSRIRELLGKRGVTMNDSNVAQALLPDHCDIIPNISGTAQGMWFERSGKIVCALPGVPFEMMEITEIYLIPRIKSRFQLPVIKHLTLLTSGMPESQMALIIKDWELNLPPNVKLAYLPSPGILRLRITGKGTDRTNIESEIEKQRLALEKLIGTYIFGYNLDLLEEQVGEMLLAGNLSLSVAESCTGGIISSLITSVPGSSAYFKGGVVAYDNEIKTDVLGIASPIIARHGAVSCEVAVAMAEGIRNKFSTDLSIAVTGIAGPAGGSTEKPVGTTWIAVASSQGTIASVYQFGEHRQRNNRKASIAALVMLKREIQRTSGL